MSRIYESVFDYMDSLYNKELGKVFTDKCREENFNRRAVAVRNCSNCLFMRGEQIVEGKTGIQ